MASIKLPAMLTIEEEDELDPRDHYSVIKKNLTVKFGDTNIASYTLTPDRWGEFSYGGEGSRLPMRYDTPEEFLAYQLQKLFALVRHSD